MALDRESSLGWGLGLSGQGCPLASPWKPLDMAWLSCVLCRRIFLQVPLN